MLLHVIAHITARPDKIEETRNLLLGLIEPTRAEAGCLRYQLFQNNADPADFTFLEEWADDEALDRHLQSQHLKDAMAKAPALLAGAPDIRRYTLVR